MGINIKPNQEFFQQLLQLYRPFESHLNIELGKHQLYRAQWTILYYLSNYGPTPLVELSSYLGVEKPTVTRTINRLEELGYVEQIPGKDKREKIMHLTAHGEQVYKEVRVTIDEYERNILSGITEEEQKDVIRIMKTIRNNILK